MKKKTTGLILGKFAPLHVGHQYLIETALSEVDEVVVVLYDCPDRTKIPLNTRAGWIRKLYPRVKVVEGWDAPNQHEDTPEVKRLQEGYISRALQGKRVTHFISSEYYGEHMSKYLNAVNRVVDMDRSKYKISSTMIRENISKHKDTIPPMVLKDLLVKVALLCIPSDKNENIAKKLSNQMSTIYVGDNLLSEINRENLSSDGVSKINFSKIGKEKHKSRSDISLFYKANKSIIYNSTILVDYVLSIGINREYDKRLFRLAEEEMHFFDLVFVVGTANDEAKYFGGVNCNFLKNQLIGNLKSTKDDYILVDGSATGIVKEIKKKISIYLENNRP